MEQTVLNLNNELYSNNNKILLEIINDLNQLKNYHNDNLSINILGKVINKINYIINENKKNFQLIRNDIYLLNKKIDNLSINNINRQELQYKDGKYIGQVVNRLAEGRGIKHFNNGDRYEGDFRNDKREGKGIYYYNNGDRYEGDFKNDKFEGKGIFYFDREPFKGVIYEGDWRNGKQEGKGIYYLSNGDRRMGDFYNGKEIGKHVRLTKNGDVETEKY